MLKKTGTWTNMYKYKVTGALIPFFPIENIPFIDNKNTKIQIMIQLKEHICISNLKNLHQMV